MKTHRPRSKLTEIVYYCTIKYVQREKAYRRRDPRRCVFIQRVDARHQGASSEGQGRKPAPLPLGRVQAGALAVGPGSLRNARVRAAVVVQHEA